MEIKLTAVVPTQPIADPKVFLGDCIRAINNTCQAGLFFMKKYPPQRLTKTGYKRTHTLMRGWHQGKAGLTGNSVEGSVSSAGPKYNIFVEGGIETQVPMFREAGWQNVDDLVKWGQPKLERELDGVLKRLAQ